MATRTQARELVVELLYAYAMGNERIFDFADELLGAKKIRNAQADFAKGLFKGILAHLQNIDSIIEANLKSWELSRLGVIDKCILRLGVYEILKGEIDAPVAINEAIEIAKILGAENTGKFVNGVLDAIRKGEFDLTKGVESSGNSSLGTPCGDFGNLGRFADFSPVSRPKFPKNSTTSTANTRIVKSNKSDSSNSADSSLRGSGKATTKQSKQNKSARSAHLKSRPLRGAKNRIQGRSSASADFLLESDKRGSPPKSEKRQLLARRGSGAGGAALLRKKTSESKKSKSDRFAKSSEKSKSGLPRFAKGKSHNDKSISKPTNRTKSTNLKNLKPKGTK